MAEESESSKTNGSTRPRASNAKAQPRRVFTDAQKAAAVKRVKKGEAVSAVAASIPVVNSVLRGWLLKAGAKKPSAADKRGRHRKKGKEPKALTTDQLLSVRDRANSIVAIRDAVGYLKHVKTDMYALLQTGEIKEFEEYHLNTLAALKRLQSVL
jgi:transposase-like protein